MLTLWAVYLLIFALLLIPWPRRRRVDMKDRRRRMEMLRAWRRDRVYAGKDLTLVRRTPWRDAE